MKFTSFVKSMLPVIAGVFLAGVLLHTFRDVEIVQRARAGFDTGIF